MKTNRLSWLVRHSSLMNPPLRNLVRKMHRHGNKNRKVRVIVQFQKKLTSSSIQALQKQLGASELPVKRRIAFLNCIASDVSLTCLKRMCGCKGIQKIYLDGVKKVSLTVATPSIGSAAGRRLKGIDGRGINVGVIDTGVYPHPDLTRPRNRIVAFKDFVRGRRRPYDDNGHGTHLAGDIAGNGRSSRGKIRGPAPGAGIVAIKAFNSAGDAYDSTIIRAIEWSIRNRKRLGLRVLTLSFGGTATTRCSEDPLCQAVEKAVRAGIVVVTAAGNSGPKRGSIESPGNSPSAITVGSVDDRRSIRQSDDNITFYSSRGPAAGGVAKPDLVAPGESITSLRAPRSRQDRETPHLRVGRHYFLLSGTSVSAAIVAGAAAQLLQQRPTLTPRQVKSILKRHASPLPFSPNAVGSGEVNVRFLLRNAGRRPRLSSMRNRLKI
ncbi:S8 family peptidase [Paenibacillus nanensis]|nr:S8 family peptidase [Paenibacillus nanensis]